MVSGASSGGVPEGVFEVRLNPDHAIFGGHFPGNPVLPGVCSMMIARECASRVAGVELRFEAVKECKFLATITPSSGPLMVAITIDNQNLNATISTDGTVALKLRATMVPEKSEERRCVAVIPVYNNAATVADVVERVRREVADVIVVNDGSTDGTGEILSTLASRGDIELAGWSKNRGKGHALRHGLALAFSKGFDHAITIDADGQHYPEDIPLFLKNASTEASNGVLLIGARNLTQENMPACNTFANRFSNFWFRVETGLKMNDTQSGFRLYPLAEMSRMRWITSGYEFEMESAVRLAWRGVRVENIPVRVFYAPDGERVSHFRPGRDFARISLLNSVLTLVALLWIHPVRFVRWLSWGNVREFVRRNITHSGESNARVAAAIGLGVFWGIAPVWGYQMILAGVTAHVLKLNKIVAVASSNISIPPMIPFILLGSFAVGGAILGRPVGFSLADVSFGGIAGNLLQYLVGSVALAVGAGMTVWGVMYGVLRGARKEPV
jgi:glycosyltransferase involved in cell wall biosynthesis